MNFLKDCAALVILVIFLSLFGYGVYSLTSAHSGGLQWSPSMPEEPVVRVENHENFVVFSASIHPAREDELYPSVRRAVDTWIRTHKDQVHVLSLAPAMHRGYGHGSRYEILIRIERITENE